MTIHEKWWKQARYDLETARSMMASGRYLYVLFCCQQTVEKAIKGVIAARSDELPPRLHNLMRLAEKAGIAVPEVRAEQLRSLTNYYIESRYPEEMEDLTKAADKTLAEEVLRYAEEILKWLSSLTK